MQPGIFYCYDAYCAWCYGFSPVIKEIAVLHKDKFSFEVLSGGMIISETPKPIAVTATYIKDTYKIVEEHTGMQFGNDYLWHINNPDKSDWYPDSEKPSIAMCVFKEYYPEDQVAFAADLQYALHYEGRDLCDDEAYRHLLGKYAINTDEFYSKLRSAEYKEKAYYEFSLVKKLQVTGFPAVLLQVNETKFYLISRGYTDYETLKARIENVWKEIHPE